MNPDIQKRSEGALNAALIACFGGINDGWDERFAEGASVIAAALAAAEAAGRERGIEEAAKVAERTVVIMNGIVIESLNANRAAILRAIRQLAGKGGE